MDIDLDWCLICSQRTQSGLYCSEECRLQDCSSVEPGLDHSDPAHHLAALDMTIYPASDSPFAGPNYPFSMPPTPPGDVTFPAYTIPYRARAPSTSSSQSSNISSCPTLSFSRRSSAAGTLPQLPAPQSQLVGNGTAGRRYSGDLFGQPTILSKPVASGGKRHSLVLSYNEIVANILSSF